MQTGRTRTWAKRALVVGLVLFAVGFVAAILAMQEAFAVVASEDPTNKARLLADAIMKAERIKSLTRFTSPVGLILFVGGIGTLIFLRLRGPSSAGLSNGQREDDDRDDDDRGEQNEDSTRSSVPPPTSVA